RLQRRFYAFPSRVCDQTNLHRAVASSRVARKDDDMKMAIMNVENLLKPLFLSIVLITAEASSALAQQSPAPNAGYGTIAGVVTTASKAPVGGATVTATRAGGGIRSTISGSDGIYTFADVLAGSWSLTITVEGAPDVL